MTHMQELKTYLANRATFFPKFEVVKKEKQCKSGTPHAVDVATVRAIVEARLLSK